MIALIALLAATMACSPDDDINLRKPGQPDANADVAPPAPEPEQNPINQATSDWRKVATDEDQARYSDILEAWSEALKQARSKADVAVTEAGAALAPSAAQMGRVQPTPGDYACSVYKLGHMRDQQPGLEFVTYPPFRCNVELTAGGDLILTKLTGSQRTRGLIYPDREDRGVYIGTQAWGDESSFPKYGENRERDQIGAVERIGDNTWRIVFPYPRQESHLDVLVLTKAL